MFCRARSRLCAKRQNGRSVSGRSMSSLWAASCSTGCGRRDDDGRRENACRRRARLSERAYGEGRACRYGERISCPPRRGMDGADLPCARLSVACLVPNGAFLYDPLYKAPEEGSGGRRRIRMNRNCSTRNAIRPEVSLSSRNFSAPSRGARHTRRTSPTARTMNSGSITSATISRTVLRIRSKGDIISRSSTRWTVF